MNLIKKISLLCCPCLLVACSSITKPVPERKTEEPSADKVTEIKSQDNIRLTAIDKVVTPPAVVVELLARAQLQMSNDNIQAAVASFERAIRIAPRHPETYLRLAELRYQQGRYSQARALAQKALSLGAFADSRAQAKLLMENISAAQ